MKVRRHTLPEWWRLVRAAVMAWADDYAPSMGAALSYYSVFSMAPLLLIVISIAGLVFGQEAARGEVFAQLAGLLGVDSAQAVQDMLTTLAKPKNGVTSTVISVVVLLIGASSVFGELQDALDRIWRAPARDRSGGWIGLVRTRLLSFGMILGIAFLLMVSLVLSAAISAFGKWWGGFFDHWELLLQIGNLVLGFMLTTLVFAMIYKLMPRVAVKWHDVWLGAATTAVLFTIGRFLIGLYIGKTGLASGYGAAGSLVVIFVWVYYSAQIFLLGAEFTWVYAKQFGSLQGTATSDAAPMPAASASASAPLPLPVVTAPAAHAAPPVEVARARRHPSALSPSMVKLGTELAVAFTMRVAIPWLVGRMAQRVEDRYRPRDASRTSRRPAPARRGAR